MEVVEIKLSVLWIVLMLTYLLGDVIRIFSGEYSPGKIMGKTATQGMWLVGTIIMVIPIVMAFLSIILCNPVNRWLNIMLGAAFFAFNLIGLPTYQSTYDKLLIIIGLIFNVLTIWFAWKWN